MAIGQALIFRTFKLSYRFARWFHAYEIKGLENLPPPGTGALLISMHSNHNFDISVGLTGLQERTGRVARGMLHRLVFQFVPLMKYLGLVPGHRRTAKHLLKSGFMAAVLPGGAEEAMYGHENAYKLHPRWGDRRGFAQVAIDAEVDIIPVFARNVEEMRFNPTFYLCNKLGITRAFQGLVDWLRPRSCSGSKMLFQIGFFLFMCFFSFSIPVPAKVTMLIGSPVKVRKDDPVDDVAIRARDALQAMISEHQPVIGGYRYAAAVRERFGAIKED